MPSRCSSIRYLKPFDASGSTYDDELRVDGQGVPFAFTAPNVEVVLPSGQRAIPRHGLRSLWVRRPLTTKPQELLADCYTRAYAPSQPGKHYRLHAAAADSKSDPKVQDLWLQALADQLRSPTGRVSRLRGG